MSAPSVDVRQVLADPSTRYWVKEQFAAACRRDPLDALADAELLVALLSERCQSACGKANGRNVPPLADVRPAGNASPRRRVPCQSAVERLSGLRRDMQSAHAQALARIDHLIAVAK